MAKGKRTPALFEIINRAQTQGQNPHLQVPGWWRNLSETAEADKNLSPPSVQEVISPEPESDRANYDRVAEAVEQAAMSSPDDDVSTTEEDAPDRGPPKQVAGEAVSTGESNSSDNVVADTWGSIRAAVTRVFRLRAGRVELSLSVASAVIAGGVLLLVLSASFAWGRASGKVAGIEQARLELEARAVDSVELARKMRPDSSVLDVRNAGNRARASARPGASTSATAGATRQDGSSQPSASFGSIRRVGWNYLVVQHFRGPDGREEAVKAERFILANMPAVDGRSPVSTEVLPNGNHILLSTLGYPPGDAPRKQALERFRQQIRRIGKLYRQRGGGYDFRDAYPMRLSHMPNRRR